MSDETPKLRLRPKLATDIPPAAAQPAVATSPPPTPEALRAASPPLPPGSTDATASAAPAAPPVAAVRFKPRVPAAPPPDAPAAPAIAAVVPDPIPSASQPAVAPAAPPPLPGVALPPGAALVAAEISPAARGSGKKVQLVALGIGFAGVLVFSLVAFLALSKTRTLSEQIAADAAAEQAAPPKRKRPTIDRDEAAAIAESAAPVAPPKKSAPTPVAATPAPAPAPPTNAVAAITPEPAAETTSAEAQAWVMQLKISGVRAGSSPKVLIGGKAFNVGDVVQADFGLVFAGYDAARDFVKFKDGNGAVYERRVR